MKFSPTRLIISIAALLGLLVLIWPDGAGPGRDDAKRNRDSKRQLPESVVGTGTESATDGRGSMARDREPKPWRADPAVVAMYSDDHEADFRHSDLSIFYESQGFTNYMGLMREAFAGDPEALGRIFASPAADGAASEGFAIGIRRLLEQLGDHYFAHQLARQNPDVQRRIIHALWPGEFDRIAAGTTPILGNQACDATGRLAARIQEAENAPSPADGPVR